MTAATAAAATVAIVATDPAAAARPFRLLVGTAIPAAPAPVRGADPQNSRRPSAALPLTLRVVALNAPDSIDKSFDFVNQFPTRPQATSCSTLSERLRCCFPRGQPRCCRMAASFATTQARSMESIAAVCAATSSVWTPPTPAPLHACARWIGFTCDCATSKFSCPSVVVGPERCSKCPPRSLNVLHCSLDGIGWGVGSFSASPCSRRPP